jgi:RNA polymerase sigma-70 factor (ECF subfamily)
MACSSGQGQSRAKIVLLPSVRSDVELVRGLRDRERWAQQMLFDRFVRRVLGPASYSDHADVIHDTFVAAFGSAKSLKDPGALSAWIRSVAAHTALNAIRLRKARSWLRFAAPADLPEPSCRQPVEAREAHDHTYAILDRMPAVERVAFALRYIEGMELQEVADACGVSLATVKRRIARGERQFVAEAQADPVLLVWIQKGDRWNPK